MKCQRCNRAEAVVNCRKCQLSSCLGCIKQELEELQHSADLEFFCQECEEQSAVRFCFACDQHLCELCNGRIHNKGKRAQHQVDRVTSSSKMRITYSVVVPADSRPLCEDSNQLFLLLCERLPTASSNEEELAPQNVHLFIEERASFELEGFSWSEVAPGSLTEEFLQEYCRYFPLHRKTVIVDSPEGRKLRAKCKGDISLLAVGEPSCNSVVNHATEHRGNISTSTENQSIAKNRKPPIAYFQFYKLAKEDKRAEVELRMRKLAAEGVLILRRKEVQPMEGVIRSFVRTIGDAEIEYCALEISYVSVESLIWVIRSVKLDAMTPGEKLILSRIKECFYIKLHSKFWQSILNYLGSAKYQSEYDRGVYGFSLPKIVLQRGAEEVQLLLKGQEWVFEDQEKLDENCEQWKDFVKFLLDYFEKSQSIPGGRYGCVQFVKTLGPESLRATSLGRLSLYVQEAINKGIIRYHKTLLVRNVCEEHVSFTNESSSFMDGEYSFSLNEKSLYIMQKELKIRTIQVALLNMLLENQFESALSLAQIPLFLKKAVAFSYSLPELGFPKLKNLIMTLSDKVDLDINKSTLTYSFHRNSETLINAEKEELRRAGQQYLRIIVEILVKIVRYFRNISVDDLCAELNTKLGFEFDFRLYNTQEFYHFLYYYCSESIYINFMSGIFIAEARHPLLREERRKLDVCTQQNNSGYLRQNPEILTPQFSSLSSKQLLGSNHLTDFFWRNHALEEDRKEEADDGCTQTKEIIDTLRSVEGILDVQLFLMQDDMGSQHTPRTVIENENIVNNLGWSESEVDPVNPVHEVSVSKAAHNKTLSAQFEDQKRITNKHMRVSSTVQRKQTKD